MFAAAPGQQLPALPKPTHNCIKFNVGLYGGVTAVSAVHDAVSKAAGMQWGLYNSTQCWHCICRHRTLPLLHLTLPLPLLSLHAMPRALSASCRLLQRSCTKMMAQFPLLLSAARYGQERPAHRGGIHQRAGVRRGLLPREFGLDRCCRLFFCG